jgi:hypothetical protein
LGITVRLRRWGCQSGYWRKNRKKWLKTDFVKLTQKMI